MRTKTRAASVLCLLPIAAVLAAAQSDPLTIGPPPGRLLDVGGHKLHLHCTGVGSPTVILESGASSFAVDWALVQPEVAKTNRVCSYDRAGMGWSEVGDPERPDRVVLELHRLLEVAGEKPPYVLVGASRGGLYTRLYQRRHPSDVVGLVQVDPAHEAGLFTMLKGSAVVLAELTPEEALSAIPAGNPPRIPARNPQTGAPFDRLPPDLYPKRVELERRLIAMISNATITREMVIDSARGDHAALSELLQASRAGERPLGALPIVVLTRGLNSSAAQRQLHASLAAQSTRGRHEVVEGAYHEIHLSHPQAVIKAIQEVAQAPRPAPAADFRCVVIYDERTKGVWRSHAAQCATRLSPASTFKIPHALVALETAVITTSTVEKWDGTRHPQQPLWERDHTVLSAMKPSVLWFFQRIAPRIGAARMHEWLDRLHYGNADTSGDVTRYWVNGTLRVSPEEQVAFLQKFYGQSLPIAAQHQRAVRDALDQDPGTQQNARGVHKLASNWPADASLNAKTGATTTEGESVSWLVGALTVGTRRYVFASAVWRGNGGVDQLAAAHHLIATFRERRILHL